MSAVTISVTQLTCDNASCDNTQIIKGMNELEARNFAKNHHGWDRIGGQDFCNQDLDRARKKFEEKQKEAQIAETN